VNVGAAVRRLVGAEPDYQALMRAQHERAGNADMDAEFFPLYEAARQFSMTSIERLYDLYKSVEYVVRAEIPGGIVECGVWKGGSMMMAALTLLKLGATDRELVLYDTFEGHPPVEPIQGNTDIFGGDGAKEWQPAWAKVSLEEVAENMRLTGYPIERIGLVKGMVEDTLPATAESLKCIAIARLDTDWYAPAKVELEALWPRLSKGGLLIIDDYGHYKGQRQAVDEYFAGKPVKLTRIDYSCRIAQRI
jgi:hypothetical protein